MSAQAGILYRDSRPVGEAVLETLRRFNEPLAPHRAGRFVADGVALLSFALHFDDIAAAERQPVRGEDGSVLTFDGRLDNRDSFFIRLHRQLAEDRTDARLMSVALEAWSSEALRLAIGDWSLARWDSRKRELLLARDYAGNRRLYYCQQSDYLAWSTAPEALVELCGLHNRVNEAYLLGFITGGTPLNETWHEGLRLVPPGAELTARAGQVQAMSTYWRFESCDLRYGDTRQYEERYRELLTEAVKVRLRARGPVFTHLSGGYDSSTVTCVAHSLVQSGQVDTPRVQPISRVMPNSPESDESVYIASVERWCGLTSIRQPIEDSLTFLPASDSKATSGNVSRTPSTEELMERAGSHVLLTGEFGDGVTDGTSSEAALLASPLYYGWRAFISESLTYCRIAREPLLGLWTRLLGTALCPRLLERTLRGKSDRKRRRERGLPRHVSKGAEHGLHDAFVTRAGLATAPRPAIRMPHLPRAARDIGVLFQRCVRNDMFTSSLGRSEARMTHPFAHRPLLEFVMSVPPSVLRRGAGSRLFVRSALRDVLPADVRDRCSKGYAEPAASRQLVRVIMDALEGDEVRRWNLVTKGYADADALTSLYLAFLDGSQQVGVIASNLFLAERHLRRLRTPAAEPVSGAVESLT